MDWMRARRPDLVEKERAEDEAMTALRLSVVRHDPGPSFDTQLFRRYQVVSAKSSVAYWSPAMIGATVAAVAVLAVLQLLTRSSELQRIDVAGTEVRRDVRSTTIFPEIGPQFPSRVR